MRPLGCPGVVCWNFEGTDGYFACALRDGDTPVCRRDPDARPEQLRIGPDTLLDYFDIGYDEWPYWCFPSDAEFRHWHADWWGRDYWRAGRYYRRVKGRKKDAKAAARRDFL